MRSQSLGKGQQNAVAPPQHPTSPTRTSHQGRDQEPTFAIAQGPNHPSTKSNDQLLLTSYTLFKQHDWRKVRFAMMESHVIKAMLSHRCVEILPRSGLQAGVAFSDPLPSDATLIAEVPPSERPNCSAPQANRQLMVLRGSFDLIVLQNRQLRQCCGKTTTWVNSRRRSPRCDQPQLPFGGDCECCVQQANPATTRRF